MSCTVRFKRHILHISNKHMKLQLIQNLIKSFSHDSNTQRIADSFYPFLLYDKIPGESEAEETRNRLMLLTNGKLKRS